LNTAFACDWSQANAVFNSEFFSNTARNQEPHV
jgi:hypothetical protein